MRKVLALATTLATIVALFSTGAQASTCGSGVFCAGAAGADITPPVTTPMWGYTARTGLPVLGSGTDPATDIGDGVTKLSSGDVAGFVAGLRTATGEEFVHDKLNADPDRYDKTFVSNHGIHLRLFANAFVLQGTDGRKVAVVQTDLGGLPGEVHQAVADKLVADKTGLDRDHVMITATHTHQGPGGIFQYQGYAILGGDEFDPRVFYAVVNGIANAIERANARLEPAKMAWGQIATSGANRNRRVSPQWCMDPESKCAADVGGTLTPTGASPDANDPLLTMVRLDTTDGVPIGVITNFAAHGTVGGDDNLLFSGDNQGWATRLVESNIAKAYSKSLPAGWEIVDALVNGAQGDQSPIGGTNGYDYGGTQREYAQMEDAGLRQMAPAIAEWQTLGTQMRSDVTMDARFEFLCFCGQAINAPYVYDGPAVDKADPLWDHISPFSALGDGGVVLDDGTSIPITTPGQGHKQPALVGAATNPSITRMQVLRLGDLLVAGVPGEPTVTSGRRISAALLALPGRAALYSKAIIAGLANDYDSYYATPEEYTAYQYEGSFTLFGQQSVPLLTEEFAGLASRMIAKTPVPDCSIPISDPVFCLTHPVHPDTSALQVVPTPIDIDPTPRAVSQPQRNVSRFEVAEFSWDGGAPSSEWRPDQDRVQLQRNVGGTWTTVAGDAHDAATILRYDKVSGAQRWTAQWDVTRDADPGDYRFHVIGAYGTGPAMSTPYTLDSIAFTVTPSTGITVRTQPGSSTTLKLSAFYPAPDQARSFRIRPAFVPDGAVIVNIDRGEGTVKVTAQLDPSGVTNIAVQPGDVVRQIILHDAFGNRAGA